MNFLNQALLVCRTIQVRGITSSNWLQWSDFRVLRHTIFLEQVSARCVLCKGGEQFIMMLKLIDIFFSASRAENKYIMLEIPYAVTGLNLNQITDRQGDGCFICRNPEQNGECMRLLLQRFCQQKAMRQFGELAKNYLVQGKCTKEDLSENSDAFPCRKHYPLSQDLGSGRCPIQIRVEYRLISNSRTEAGNKTTGLNYCTVNKGYCKKKSVFSYPEWK